MKSNLSGTEILLLCARVSEILSGRIKKDDSFLTEAERKKYMKYIERTEFSVNEYEPILRYRGMSLYGWAIEHPDGDKSTYSAFTRAGLGGRVNSLCNEVHRDMLSDALLMKWRGENINDTILTMACLIEVGYKAEVLPRSFWKRRKEAATNSIYRMTKRKWEADGS